MSPTILPIRIENEIERIVENMMREGKVTASVREVNDVRNKMREIYASVGAMVDPSYREPVYVIDRDSAARALDSKLCIFTTCEVNGAHIFVKAFAFVIMTRVMQSPFDTYSKWSLTNYPSIESVIKMCEELQPVWTEWGSGL